MTQPIPIYGPELQRRRVLFAVALIDPITGATVNEGLRVSVDELTAPPIVNRSGYFVWLAEEPLRPTTLTIMPQRAPFEPDTSPIPALPDPPADDASAPVVADSARLLRIFLRPTAAYPFPDNALVLRGTLRETAAESAASVPGARVTIEWQSEPPGRGAAPANRGGPPVWIASPASGLTDSRGTFAVALALPAGAKPLPAESKDITVRIRVDRGGDVSISNDIELPAASGVPVSGRGNNWSFKNPIAWSGLTPA